MQVSAITCDRCRKTYDDVLERQEFLCWADTGGYGNIVFGDMSRVEIDLCQYCVIEVLGQWVRVLGEYRDNFEVIDEEDNPNDNHSE
jgi:hypothetical protein